MTSRTRFITIVASTIGGLLHAAACSDQEGAGVAPGDKVSCRNDAACASVFPLARSCEEAACVDGVCELRDLPDGTFCNDGQRCTDPDSCRAGACGGTPIGCDDGNQCTEDFCDPKEGCVFDALVATCDDGNPCTENDVCTNKSCLSGQPVADCCIHDAECDDQDACTDDRCTDNACAYDFNDAPCNDGNPCTKLDRCSGGACAGGELLTCDDNYPCTLDECDTGTGLCVSTAAADGIACDDRNECTSSDTCQSAMCIGTGNVCECTTDADCVDMEDGSLCNGTLVCEGHQCVLDLGTTITCADSGSVCAPSACDPLTGQCAPTAAPNGTLCDDQNRCTLGDTCDAGVCSGIADQCDDGNPCTFDQCHPETGCAHIPNSLPCDDGVPCTTNDTCGPDSTCAGVLLDCDDDNPCTDDACGSGECTNTPNILSCNDNNACTSGERCGGGTCGGGVVLCECQNDNDCEDSEDGNLCNGTLECVNNKCVVDPSTVVTCSTTGDTTCRKTQCHTASGQCVPVDTPNGTSCNDGSACTGPDVCTAGVCGGAAVNCNDQNPCTNDACTPATGCTHANNTTSCNDNNACTQNDQCSGGSCAGSTVSCDDNNVCTSDSCNPTSGCAHSNAANGTSCADSDQCDGTEECQNGSCINGAPPVCDDGNVCTNDSCQASSGCVHSNVSNGTNCADSDVCDGAETCFGGTCINGTALVCSDGDACTTDDCIPSSGCEYTPITCGGPTITCGADISTVPMPDPPVTVTGSAFDPDGGPVTYQWVVTSRPTGSTSQPSSPNSSTTSFLPDVSGVFELTLTATDDEGLTASCSVFVTAESPEALRVELLWDTPYGDGDLHLIRPNVTVASAWYTDDDCWYGNQNANKWPPNGAAGNASLDIDDTDGYGPENVNVDTQPVADLYTIGISYYCSHSLDTRGGPPRPVNPGDGPATALVRIHCGNKPVVEITGLDFDESGRFIEVARVHGGTCTVTPILDEKYVWDITGIPFYCP